MAKRTSKKTEPGGIGQLVVSKGIGHLFKQPEGIGHLFNQPVGIGHILGPMLQRQSEWLVSNGFPDDLDRAVKIAVAELGEFVTSADVREFPMDNVWELLKTCVDRRKWLANFHKPAAEIPKTKRARSTKPRMPVRKVQEHWATVMASGNRDLIQEYLTLAETELANKIGTSRGTLRKCTGFQNRKAELIRFNREHIAPKRR